MKRFNPARSFDRAQVEERFPAVKSVIHELFSLPEKGEGQAYPLVRGLIVPNKDILGLLPEGRAVDGCSFIVGLPQGFESNLLEASLIKPEVMIFCEENGIPMSTVVSWSSSTQCELPFDFIFSHRIYDRSIEYEWERYFDINSDEDQLASNYKAWVDVILVSGGTVAVGGHIYDSDFLTDLFCHTSFSINCKRTSEERALLDRKWPAGWGAVVVGNSKQPGLEGRRYTLGDC